MFQVVEARMRELARRAGFARVPTPVLFAALALLSVAVVAALVRWWPQPAAEPALTVSHASAPSAAGASTAASVTHAVASAPEASSAASSSVCVHVVGAVRSPGVYTLPDGSRTRDAVDAAGGMTPDGASSAINLAAKLADGEQVVVPTDAQVKAGAVPVAAAAPGAATGAASASPGAVAAKVDLNSADATALDALPGVGPSTAAKIVADRQANGPFRTVDDLSRVPGIGPKKLDQLKPLVCVR